MEQLRITRRRSRRRTEEPDVVVPVEATVCTDAAAELLARIDVLVAD